MGLLKRVRPILVSHYLLVLIVNRLSVRLSLPTISAYVGLRTMLLRTDDNSQFTFVPSLGTIFNLFTILDFSSTGIPIPTEIRIDQFFFGYTAIAFIYACVATRLILHEICDVLGVWCFDIVTPHPGRKQE